MNGNTLITERAISGWASVEMGTRVHAVFSDANGNSMLVTLTARVGGRMPLAQVRISAMDLTLSMDDFAERFLAPAIEVMGGRIVQ